MEGAVMSDLTLSKRATKLVNTLDQLITQGDLASSEHVVLTHLQEVYAEGVKEGSKGARGNTSNRR